MMLKLLHGSDLNFRLIWPGSDGQPEPLDGCVVDAHEASPILADKLELSLGDEVGEIIGRITWSDQFRYGVTMSFRVRLTLGEARRTTPIIKVNIV